MFQRCVETTFEGGNLWEGKDVKDFVCAGKMVSHFLMSSGERIKRFFK